MDDNACFVVVFSVDSKCELAFLLARTIRQEKANLKYLQDVRASSAIEEQTAKISRLNLALDQINAGKYDCELCEQYHSCPLRDAGFDCNNPPSGAAWGKLVRDQ